MIRCAHEFPAGAHIDPRCSKGCGALRSRVMAQRKAPKSSVPTDRQDSIVEFMLEYQEEHGAPPTMREICNHIGASSTNSATCHLHALLVKGLVRHYPGRARGWVAKDKA